MVDVDNKNYEAIYPDIENDLKECDFLSFDIKYISLKLPNVKDYKMSDDVPARYAYITQIIKSFIPFQLGISIFKRDQCPNGFPIKYKASIYNIHICPVSLNVYDGSFKCSPEELKCLRDNGADLGKIIENGVNYINKDEFNIFKFNLDTSTIIKGLNNDQYDFLEEQRFIIDEFIESDCTCLELETMPGLHEYFQQDYIRAHYLDISTEYVNDKIKIEKVSFGVREELDKLENNCDPKSLKYKFCTEIMGVSKIFRLIAKLKKPVVGFSCFMDITAIYQKFYNNLPTNFDKFCVNIQKHLPNIFDTEHIFNQIKDNSSELHEIDGNIEQLYNNLAKINDESGDFGIKIESNFNVLGSGDSNAISNPVDNTPLLRLAEISGHDAFMAGCCLLYMANMLMNTNQLDDENEKPEGASSIAQIGSSDEFNNNEPSTSYNNANQNSSLSFEDYEDLLKPLKNSISVESSINMSVKLDDVSSVPDVCQFSDGKKLLKTHPYWLIVYQANNVIEDGDIEDDVDDLDFGQAFLEKTLDEFGGGELFKMKPIKRDKEKQHFLVAMTNYKASRLFERHLKEDWPNLIVKRYYKWTANPWVRGLLLGATIASSVVTCVFNWSSIKEYVNGVLFHR